MVQAAGVLVKDAKFTMNFQHKQKLVVKLNVKNVDDGYHILQIINFSKTWLSHQHFFHVVSVAALLNIPKFWHFIGCHYEEICTFYIMNGICDIFALIVTRRVN